MLMLSAIEFYWGVSTQVNWCKIPFDLKKKSCIMNLVPLSVLIHLILELNWILTIVENCSNSDWVSDLAFNK